MSLVYNYVFYLGWTDLCTHLPMKSHKPQWGRKQVQPCPFRAETKPCLQELKTPERQHQLIHDGGDPISTRLHLFKGPSTTIIKTMFINPWETSYIQPQQGPARIPSWEVTQAVTLGNPPAAHSLSSDIMSLSWWLIAGSSMPPSDARTPLPHQRFQSEQWKAMRQEL